MNHDREIINGSPMTERDIYLRLMNHLAETRDLARGLAHSRKSIHWLAISKILEEVRDKVGKLMLKGTGLVLPISARHN